MYKRNGKGLEKRSKRYSTKRKSSKENEINQRNDEESKYITSGRLTTRPGIFARGKVSSYAEREETRARAEEKLSRIIKLSSRKREGHDNSSSNESDIHWDPVIPKLPKKETKVNQTKEVNKEKPPLPVIQDETIPYEDFAKNIKRSLMAAAVLKKGSDPLKDIENYLKELSRKSTMELPLTPPSATLSISSKLISFEEQDKATEISDKMNQSLTVNHERLETTLTITSPKEVIERYKRRLFLTTPETNFKGTQVTQGSLLKNNLNAQNRNIENSENEEAASVTLNPLAFLQQYEKNVTNDSHLNTNPGLSGSQSRVAPLATQEHQSLSIRSWDYVNGMRTTNQSKLASSSCVYNGLSPEIFPIGTSIPKPFDTSNYLPSLKRPVSAVYPMQSHTLRPYLDRRITEELSTSKSSNISEDCYQRNPQNESYYLQKVCRETEHCNNQSSQTLLDNLYTTKGFDNNQRSRSTSNYEECSSVLNRHVYVDQNETPTCITSRIFYPQYNNTNDIETAPSYHQYMTDNLTNECVSTSSAFSGLF